jgi:hypothetical protein
VKKNGRQEEGGKEGSKEGSEESQESGKEEEVAVASLWAGVSNEPRPFSLPFRGEGWGAGR